MLAASEALDVLREEPGCPAVYEIRPPLGPKRMQAAVEEVRVAGGGILYALAAAPSALAMARVWLAQAGGQDLRTIRVAEGWLLLAYVPAEARVVVEPRKRKELSLLQVLRLHGKATTREVAEILGCSRPVIGKVLTGLVAEGRARPTVEAGRSPFQAYEAVEH